MQQLRFVVLPALFVAIGAAGACSVYDESLLGGGGGDSTSSGDGGETGDGGNGPTTDGSSTASGSTGNVTTGGGCTTVDECPGDDTACSIRACEDGICSVQNEVQGVEVPDQTPGDCVTLVCDGSGGIETVNDDADVPADDGNACTASVCADGAPDHVAVGDGESCNQDGGKLCVGEACVACITEDDCDGPAQCSDANTCVAPQCNNMRLDPGETGIDCGGPNCDPCPLSQPCDVDADCLSGECNGTCQPSCTDGVLNNGETTTDCGGPNCEQCPLGSACAVDTDCDSDQCLSSVCRPRIFFSEYVEGSGSNKAVEIFNYGNVALDLGAATCSVKLFSNGNSTAGTTIALAGTVDAFDVHVLTEKAPDPMPGNPPAPYPVEAYADQKNGNLSFNGNDAVVLECMGVRLDVFGQIGFDPGNVSNPAPGWGTDPTNSVDNTLRRKPSVIEGDPDGTNAFDPAVQWDGFPEDTFGGLGSH